MTNLTAVMAQAHVTDGLGVTHVFRAYGRSRYEARKALFNAARVTGNKVVRTTITYRFDSVDEQISYPEPVFTDWAGR